MLTFEYDPLGPRIQKSFKSGAGLEACCGSYYWLRVLSRCVHHFRLIDSQFVNPHSIKVIVVQEREGSLGNPSEERNA